jgi:4,5-DOPA dioxygenase extradiol
VPKPKAILMISAHWEGHGLAVTGNKMPPTIHDFGNFGEELFSI